MTFLKNLIISIIETRKIWYNPRYDRPDPSLKDETRKKKIPTGPNRSLKNYEKDPLNLISSHLNFY